jgi:CO/xanthine dehydrogenase Mo-binding subunit
MISRSQAPPRAVFVRSPHAHARIQSIDVTAARKHPGVLAIITGADVTRAGLKPIPHAIGSSHQGSDVPLRNRDGSERLATEQLLLPTDCARFAGEAIALGRGNAGHGQGCSRPCRDSLGAVAGGHTGR